MKIVYLQKILEIKLLELFSIILPKMTKVNPKVVIHSPKKMILKYFVNKNLLFLKNKLPFLILLILIPNFRQFSSKLIITLSNK
jgi:hypothetical protein